MKELNYNSIHRVSILHDGVEIMGLTCLHKRPENDEELLKMLKDFVEVLESPALEDKEIF